MSFQQCEFPGCTHAYPEHYFRSICADRRGHMILLVASAAHEVWREQYRAAHGDKPRIKTTKDQTYIDAMLTDQVDIASLNYPSLPSDWQEENRLSSEVAVDIGLEAVGREYPLDEHFVEIASA